MPRYFLELTYKGTAYSGFQVQDNAETVQSEVEKALQTFFRENFTLTGSSRTDAGVHANQNFFHFDTDHQLLGRHIYNLNAILPADIAVKGLYAVSDTAHCRFDAVARQYRYYIYQQKNPFLAALGTRVRTLRARLRQLSRALLAHRPIESVTPPVKPGAIGWKPPITVGTFDRS